MILDDVCGFNKWSSVMPSNILQSEIIDSVTTLGLCTLLDPIFS